MRCVIGPCGGMIEPRHDWFLRAGTHGIVQLMLFTDPEGVQLDDLPAIAGRWL